MSILTKEDDFPCISFIGMAGAGKTTVSKAFAQYINWPVADTDHIIEASYATNLQSIADKLTKEAFLDLESQVITQITLKKTVISTGGSVVYREETMKHLAKLGTIVHIKVSLPLILQRIAKNPNRGLAIAPGQTIEDLFYEREELYQKYAKYTLEADSLSPLECAKRVKQLLQAEFPYL